ncbi:MAG: TetR/AcrR family transcriptional regulator [Solirubrobacteraceae bacterium]|nr:TetR/AcrR family transcriptional regulator [Solirubrobacteraceae bacterium]
MPTSSDTTDDLAAAAPAVGGKGSSDRGAKPVTRKRVPAEQRREEVLRVAAEVIALDGMHAASTASIAKAAGMSHAYLFRLFPTKEELLCAVAAENCRRIAKRMTEAGEAAATAFDTGATPPDPDAASAIREMLGKPEPASPAEARREAILGAMGVAWRELLTDRTLLQVNLQGISASSNSTAIGDVMRAGWEKVVLEIERISGADANEARGFVAQGTLLLVISGLGAEESDWATRLHHGPLPCAPDGPATLDPPLSG